MKTQFLNVFMVVLFGAIPALAGFSTVKQKFCDQKEVQPRRDERIFLDLKRYVFGVGFTGDDNCKVVDFKTVALQSANNEETVLVPVAAIGRRNSCNLSISDYGGPNFTTLFIKPGMLKLNGLTGACKSVTYLY